MCGVEGWTDGIHWDCGERQSYMTYRTSSLVNHFNRSAFVELTTTRRAFAVWNKHTSCVILFILSLRVRSYRSCSHLHCRSDHRAEAYRCPGQAHLLRLTLFVLSTGRHADFKWWRQCSACLEHQNLSDSANIRCCSCPCHANCKLPRDCTFRVRTILRSPLPCRL